MEETKLNIKQELFCKYYLELGGNGTSAYMKAYKTKNYETAKVNASKLLTITNVWERIYELMKNAWFNDISIDLELSELIKQSGNLGIKLRAIIEYNKLRRRYNDYPSDLLNNTGVIFLPSREMDQLTIEDNRKPIEGMTMKELESLRQELLH